MSYKPVYLKPQKEIPVRNKHHWLFSGAIARSDRIQDGEIVKVYSSNKELLGHGYFNSQSAIQVRMLNYSTEDPMQTLEKNIYAAFEMRNKLFGEDTNTYRVINGEGDRIPGLIVDRYNSILVLQIATVGIDQLKEDIVRILVEACKTNDIDLKTIYEKSTMAARTKDGLEKFEGVLLGDPIAEFEVKEYGVKYMIDLPTSQKTGLFLDMREMRKLVGELAKDKTLLNCFAYTGGFSLAAAKGGAIKVDSVDIDPNAIDMARRNFHANEFECDASFVAEDAFEFLHNEDLTNYDFIILDPPAFAKKKEDLPTAKKGYYKINRTAMDNIKPGSFLLTCSCSYHLAYEEFERIILTAARDAKRDIKIIQKHRLAFDHPLNIYHKEIDYLKSLMLYVE